jgi:hypothetical protein
MQQDAAECSWFSSRQVMGVSTASAVLTSLWLIAAAAVLLLLPLPYSDSAVAAAAASPASCRSRMATSLTARRSCRRHLARGSRRHRCGRRSGVSCILLQKRHYALNIKHCYLEVLSCGHQHLFSTLCSSLHICLSCQLTQPLMHCSPTLLLLFVHTGACAQAGVSVKKYGQTLLFPIHLPNNQTTQI